MKNGKQTDAAYYFTKLATVENQLLPAWTGFNIQLKGNDIPPLTNIAYLPVIDASPVEMATIKTILDRSISIADELGLENMDIVADQAIYCKLQQIRWENEEYSRRLVIRMGEFHTCMAFLACIGKRFGDAGLQDILIESGVVAPGSVPGVLNGHHYNRSIRSLKLFCEALQRLRWQSFLKTLPKEERENAYKLARYMQAAFPGNKYEEMTQSSEYCDLLTKYQEFIHTNNANNETFKIWSSFIEMFEVLLLFIRATREGDWVLHLACLRYLLIWFFAYDRPNYSRHGTVHWLEMYVLKDTHPNIDSEFKKGNFVAQRHDHHGFSQTACDQVIEQTVNLDSKTKGGITMYTLKQGAVHRFMLSAPERAAITRECHKMAGQSISTDNHNELQNSRMQRDEKDIQSITATLESMVNPFDNTLESDKLYHLASGSVAIPSVMEDLNDAKEIGEKAVVDFCKTRLQKNEVGFYDPIKKNKLKTFKDSVKPVVSKVKGKELALKSDRDTFARCLIVGNVRNISIDEMLTYTLGPQSASLAYPDGSLMKTNKAVLMETMITEVTPSPHVDIPAGSTWIWDAMALIQSMKRQPTFEKFADAVLQVLLKNARKTNSKFVHFVPDQYWENSIKDAERNRRGADKLVEINIYKPDLDTPPQWSKYLSSGKNKEKLLNFLYMIWCKVDKSVLGDITIVVGHGNECHKIYVNDQNSVEVLPIPELYSTQEEADTRLLLHSAHVDTTTENIVISSPDTDVFVLSLASCMDIDAKLYFHSCKGGKSRTIALRQIFQHFGKEVCAALIGCHCISGCDTVSAFHGIGKKKAFTLMKSNQKHQMALTKLGDEFTVSEDILNDLEAYVCELYGQKDCLSVNEARVKMFKCGKYDDLSLPPNQDSLFKHINRANFQAGILKRCMLPNPEIPSPIGNGWKKIELDNIESLAIDWMSLSSAPSTILELVHCSCKKTKCESKRCTCRSNELPCTDLCVCVDCQNKEIDSDLITYDQEGDSINLDDES